MGFIFSRQFDRWWRFSANHNSAKPFQSWEPGETIWDIIRNTHIVVTCRSGGGGCDVTMTSLWSLVFPLDDHEDVFQLDESVTDWCNDGNKHDENQKQPWNENKEQVDKGFSYEFCDL